MSNSPTILAPASVQPENAHHAEAAPLNGNGFYRFKIGAFQATVISEWLWTDTGADLRCEYR